jgi:polysaccharide deacetylase family protein (PEP-CTERM system associated)
MIIAIIFISLKKPFDKGGAGLEKIMNIMQIDVEDWFCDFDIREWHRYECRVEKNTDKILEMLRIRDMKATFFVLGALAEKFPGMVERIKAGGHEVGSHGYGHNRATKMSPNEFEDDLVRSIRVLERITGDKVIGFRAPQFTVVKKTAWIIDILIRNGIKYDSSIFPATTPFYGVREAPLYPYQIEAKDIVIRQKQARLWEVPLSIYKLPALHLRIPIAGGFYLRLFPYSFISGALKKINDQGHPIVCYIHPWEVDPGFPRVKGLRWTYYYGLKENEEKYGRLLDTFQFTSTREWLSMNYGPNWQSANVL